MAETKASVSGQTPQLEDAFREIGRRIEPQGTLLHVRDLAGGVSARVTMLDVARSDGSTLKLVVREHGAVDRQRNPHIARDEFHLLQIVRRHGVAAPAPYHYDETCTLLPTPYVVAAYVDGQTDFAPPDLDRYLTQAAAQLAAIHQVSSASGLAFLSRSDNTVERPLGEPDTSLDEPRICAALARWPVADGNDTVLLHGDYWPGNLLWRDHDLVAVLDWEDACLGDPLADLANSRLEVLWAFGQHAMATFTDHYHSLTTIDFTDLPARDLRAALRPCGKLSGWGLDPTTERRMRARHRQFVSHAIAALADR